MSVIPEEPADSSRTADPGQAPADVSKQSLKSLGLRKLLATLPLVIASFSVFWGAAASVFIPIQVQAIDPATQASSLALVIGIGAVASMVGAPIAGALSDRTRTRIGGREPWMIAGAVSTLGLAAVTGFVTSIPLLVVLMVAMQFTTNFILTPASAYLPDRVPVAKRGVFSSVYGVAQLVGGIIGAVLGAGFASLLPVGYLLVAGILAALTILFSLLNAQSNRHEPRTPFTLRTLFGAFWVNPIANPDFAWVFLGRFLLFTGFYPIQTFSLYLMQDYIGLGAGAVDAIPATNLAGLIGLVLGTALSGPLAQRLGRTKPLVYASSAIIAVSLVIPLLWPTLTGLLVFNVLTCLGVGAYMSVDLVLVTLVLPSAEETGKDLGIINITTTLPQTFGAAIGGVAVGIFGGYGSLFPIAIVATVLGTVVLAFVRGAK
ncbi:MFS transporter [Amycolatopsis jejuensis]|uniref:MFS transporter n=1 Tax=Amycolatopsis jejuensis TaxID=330084 RepID=UPI0005258E64|nr:MFS transporter [Amycolatopsis jejuensis]